MTVSARSEDLGGVEAAIPVYTESNPGRVALNLSYLQGKYGLATIELSGEQSPVLYRYGGSPSVLIMPTFLQQKSGAAPAEAGTAGGYAEKE